MRAALPLFLALLTSASCVSRFTEIEGTYELTRYHGKPLPFEGVRAGKITLTLDGEFSSLTQRAVVLGQLASVTDTVVGRYRLEGWGGGCTSILLRFEDQSLEPEVRAEVCDGELTIPDHGVLFRKRR